MNKIPIKKINLAHLPTPIEEMPNLTKHLGGPKLFIKRDDQTGLATGGNKTRKLEYLMADVIKNKADVILTAGAAQSNHCRQTAAAAAKFGIECRLLLGGAPETIPDGNLLIDLLCGAQIIWTGNDRTGGLLGEEKSRLLKEGRNPYVIPYGGSNEIGALGYVEAMEELQRQQESLNCIIDHIIIASSSCGTQGGLTIGSKLYDYKGKITGISIDKVDREKDEFMEDLVNLTNQTSQSLELPYTFSKDDFTVNFSYVGEGYGIVGDLERNAIKVTAANEGILLDPVYTGRAMGGLIDLIDKGTFKKDETVLFWHTGGIPALFAKKDDLL